MGVESPGDGVTFLGHSTVLIELGGARLLTDPVLRDRVAYIRRRVAAPEQRHLERLDAVLVSHAHHDHLDVPSLRLLRGDPLVVVPRGLGARVRRNGLRNVEEVAEGERFSVDGLTVIAVHAEHDGRRYPGGRRYPTLGYVVEGRQRIYFAGDTDLFDGMSELRGLDVGLIPISGWGPRVGPGHLDPERAAEAVARIRPRIAVPVHWGTLSSRSKLDIVRPAEEFERLAESAAPEVDVIVVRPGGRLALAT